MLTGDLRIVVGEVFEEWEEKEGPTPKPSSKDLRNWDLKLLRRYKPNYSSVLQQCSLCAYGPCDLSKGKKGACGVNLETQLARENLLLSVIGACAHTSHARHLLNHLIKEKGRYFPLRVAENTEVEAPWARLVLGIRPRVLADLERVLSYVEEQLTHLLASVHMGQEADHLDYNSKALHAGMLDHVAMEVAELAQISALDFPRGTPQREFVEIGFGCVDAKKPVILCIGHNVLAGAEILDYVEEKGYDVEVVGICCTAHELVRYSKKAKIIGSLSYQLLFVRAGIADAILLDEQCIRLDTVENAKALGIPVITTSEKVMCGLERFEGSAEEAIGSLLKGASGLYIPDPELAAKVAVEAAIISHKLKARTSPGEAMRAAKECSLCGLCEEACPLSQRPMLIVASVNYHFNKLKPDEKRVERPLSLKEIETSLSSCRFCGKCESWCPMRIKIVSVFSAFLREKLSRERARIRRGRGAIQDVEIRKVGAPIVFGEIPGILAVAGCSLWPGGEKQLAEIVEEFLKRRYIVVASGCAAMALATDHSGTANLYERYEDCFDGGCLINAGSCVASSHITGAVIKIANIFGRSLRGNFEEIADYCLNRIGAVALVWGPMSAKALAIANGAVRLGIPVILGPTGLKYKRELLGDPEEREAWEVYDTKGPGKHYVGPVPQHLCCVAKSKEEAMVLIPKLCMRPNDGPKGRQVKLAHYVDVHEKVYGRLPDDLEKFVRTDADLPLARKDELLKYIKQKGWKPIEHRPDPTLLERFAGK